MPITFTVRPGYTFSSGEKVTYSKLNLLGSPRIEGSGILGEADIADGAVSTQKLKSPININSKIDDHNLALSKLAEGTHGQVLFYNTDGDLVTLGAGTDGYFLQTKGPAADPQWAAPTGDESIAVSRIVSGGNNKQLTTDSSGTVQWEDKTTGSTLYTSYFAPQTLTTSLSYTDNLISTVEPASAGWVELDMTSALSAAGESGTPTVAMINLYTTARHMRHKRNGFAVFSTHVTNSADYSTPGNFYRICGLGGGEDAGGGTDHWFFGQTIHVRCSASDKILRLNYTRHTAGGSASDTDLTVDLIGIQYA